MQELLLIVGIRFPSKIKKARVLIPGFFTLSLSPRIPVRGVFSRKNSRSYAAFRPNVSRSSKFLMNWAT